MFAFLESMTDRQFKIYFSALIFALLFTSAAIFLNKAANDKIQNQELIIQRILADNKETLSLLLAECKSNNNSLNKDICNTAYSANIYRVARIVVEQENH